jgi:ATP-dependent DNA ligase
MSSDEPAVMPRDPRQWRPLEARSRGRAPTITDPIIEPNWRGLRVLAHFKSTPAGPARATVELVDIDGLDVSAEFEHVVQALVEHVNANDAVLDGVLTDQALAGGLGIGVVPTADLSPVGVFLGRKPEVSVSPPRPRATRHDTAFVATDLLAVDGESLFDLPLLERKRQLDGLLLESEYARVSPFARPPLEQWFNSWKSAGFSGVVLKAANSRYRPADVARQWAVVERMGRR